MTLAVALCSYAISLLLAFFFLFLRKNVSRPLQKAIDFYPQIFRSLPELLIIFFLFYGSGFLLSKIFDAEINPSPLISGVFALSAVYSAFLFETLRGAQQALAAGETTAAEAIGLSPFQIFVYIQWPTIWRVALPSLGNLWLSLIKETALISIIGLSDLMRAATITSQATQLPFTTFFLVSLMYLSITLISILMQNLLIARFSKGKARAHV